VRIALERGGDLLVGSQVGNLMGRELWTTSSEAEFRPRGRPALERRGVSSEGASSPRARWSFGSTALDPSSEAEFRPRGAGTGRLMSC
jgi:hypothetical protein